MYNKNREPVGNTCPDIDEAIKILECLRDANSKLREWGNKEAERVDELEKELDDKNSYYDKIERERDSLVDEVESLKEEINNLPTL